MVTSKFSTSDLAKLLQQRTPDPEASTLVNTADGIVLGTLSYMSPEQARGLEVDARTDIWSLGVVIYEMVTGRQPFEGKTMSDMLAAVLDQEPAPLARYSPDAPADLERIIRKALAKDPDQRYQTVKDLLVDLKALIRELDHQTSDLNVPGRYKQQLKPAVRLALRRNLLMGSRCYVAGAGRRLGISFPRPFVVDHRILQASQSHSPSCLSFR